MRYGVVIGCVGVVAAAAVSIGMYMKPAMPEVIPAIRTATATPIGRPRTTAKANPAPKVVRPAAPVAAAPTGGLPIAYRILLSRSIFSPHPHATGPAAASAESAITLRGVMQWGRGLVAFVENTASGDSRLVHVGDAVGHGKISAIDLRYVEYIEGKRAKRIAVGQTFNGESSNVAVNGPALATTHTIVD
jgi:hypothetical protein